MLKCLSLELRQCRREYGLLSLAILIGFFIVGLGFGYFGFNSTRLTNIEHLFLIFFSLFSFSIAIVWLIVVVRLFTTYKNNMFKVNGYLYNTLPVKTWEMVAAKVIFVNVWEFIFGLVLLLGLFIFFIGVIISSALTVDNFISESIYVLRQIDWILIIKSIKNLILEIGFVNIITTCVQEILINSSIYLVGILVITLYYTSWVQRFHKVTRVIIGIFATVIFIYFVSNLRFTINSLTIFITTLGILSFIGTCYLIDHKVDVNC